MEMNRRKLRKKMTEVLQKDELEKIVSELNIDWPISPDPNLSSQIIVLLDQIGMQGRENELLDRLQFYIPKQNWSEFSNIQLHDLDEKNQSKHLFIPPPPVEHYIKQQNLFEIIDYIKHFDSAYKRVVVHGMAGVGKSALAKQLAYDLSDQFPDGVLWIDLSDTSTVDGKFDQSVMSGIVQDLIHLFDVTLSGETFTKSAEILQRILTTKQHLIILDNAYGHEYVEPFLPPYTSKSSVIVTSRNSRILGSHVSKQVKTLPFSRQEGVEFMQEWLGKERVTREIACIDRLIELLGGHPLALRLAVGTIINEDLPICYFVEDLEHDQSNNPKIDFNLLGAVQASIESSFNKLDPLSKKVFLSMGLFDSSEFDESALVYIHQNNASSGKVKRAISYLKARSMIIPVPTSRSKQSPENRITLHKLLRDFAREKLPSLDSASDTGQKKIRDDELLSRSDCAQLVQNGILYYTNFVSKHRHKYRRIGSDWTNIRFSLSKLENNWDAYARLLHDLTSFNLGVMGFMDSYGHWADAENYLNKIPVSKLDQNKTYIEIKTLLKMGGFDIRQNKITNGHLKLNQSLSLLKALPEEEKNKETNLWIGYAYGLLAESMIDIDPLDGLNAAERGIEFLNNIDPENYTQEISYLEIQLATAHARVGSFDIAERLIGNALENIPENKPSAAKISGLNILGIISYMRGKFDSAKSNWLKGLGLAESLGDIRGTADFYRNLATMSELKGQVDQSISYNKQALDVYEKINDESGYGNTLSNLSVIYCYLESFDQAKVHWEKALAIANSKNRQLDSLEAYALTAKGRWELTIPDPQLENARLSLSKSLEMSIKARKFDLVPEIYRLQARCSLLENKFPEARKLIDKAFDIKNQIDHDIGSNWWTLGDIYSLEGKLDEADKAYKRGKKYLDYSTFHNARLEFGWAEHKIRINDLVSAQELLLSASNVFERLDDPSLQKKVEQRLAEITRG